MTTLAIQSRALVIGAVTLLAATAATPAFAQLSPTGTHYAGRASDTGHSPVSGTGAYATSVPLDLPPARGGMAVPVALTYGRRGVGAGGLGWDVPLSYVRRDSTVARRRPAYAPGQVIGAREQIVVSLGGHPVTMVPDGNIWRARQDAVDLELHAERADTWPFLTTWRLLDGAGHELIFTAPHPAMTPGFDLDGSGLWLLASISSVDRVNRIDLEYEMTPHSFTGGNGIAIDLVSVRYNTHPSTPTCTKDEIRLAYEEPSTEPLSLSLLGNLPIVRMRKLHEIAVMERGNCGSLPDAVRRYQLEYVTDGDPDTGLPLLSKVSLKGRDGTPQASETLPVATYGYGKATVDKGDGTRALVYQRGTDVALPSDVPGTTPPIASTYYDPGASSPSGGKTQVSWQNLVDVSGDGRPDLVYAKNGQLWVAMNRPAAGSATSLTAIASLPLNDSVFTAGPLASHSSKSERYDYGLQNEDSLWRQQIDLNGDGRLDIIDAAEEPGKWTIYLNTPGNPVTWVKRSFSITALRDTLVQYGHVIEGDYLPLSRRTTGYDLAKARCYRWNSSTNSYELFEDGWGEVCFERVSDPIQCAPGSVCKASSEKTFVEWEIRDLNGDGYPDVAFNSSPVRNLEWQPPTERVDDFMYGVFVDELRPVAGDDNVIKAVLDVVGVRFDVGLNPFSAPVTLKMSSCGVALWRDDECPLPFCTTPDRVPDEQYQVCGIEDVNGDGIADRIEGTQVRLGSGDTFATWAVTMQLPGVPKQLNQHESVCDTDPGEVYDPKQLAMLRDLTGDGLPDFVELYNGAWRVWIGTGTGFRPPVAIEIPTEKDFAISNAREECSGHYSNTMGGLYDLDGDGKPEVVHILHLPTHLEVYHLAGETPGNPAAGRLTTIDNGYGAATTITYRSAKEDASRAHQVPFPEIVVTSVETTGAYGLGGTLSAVRYAYGDAEMFFDPALDSFTMRAYGRSVEVHGTGREAWEADFAIIRQTYGLPAFVSGMTDAERFGRYEKAGRLSDVYVLSNNVQRDPWEVLATFDPFIDSRRIANEHYEWDSRYVPLQQYSISEDCADIVDPYNWSQTWLPRCAARGFAYRKARETWLGTQPPPSSWSNVQTRYEVLEVDDFGNVLRANNENDRNISEDDLCVEMTYAQPTASARIFSALATRRITNCMPGEEVRTLSFDTWEYDALPVGSVAVGRSTSHTIERHATDDGQQLDPAPIREYEAGYDGVGNANYVVSAREDGAVRVLETTYDEFGLVPVGTSVDGSGLSPLDTSIDRDAVTLEARSQLDANGTRWGREVDGYGRVTRATVQPPNGALGVVSTTSYDGFSGPDPRQRTIHVTSFADPIPPGEVGSATGRERIVYLDEIGRTWRVKENLGSDYASESMILLSRVYDGLGRISFEADPYPESQDGATAYGTTYHFGTDGMLKCSIRGNGPQPFTTISDLAAERFPTCVTRVFGDHKVQIMVNTPDSLLGGTPQEGVVRIDTMSAIGRLLTRETVKNGTRLELSTFDYDRFGNTTTLSRYLDPAGYAGYPPTGGAPVAWSWRFDSLGQTLFAHEPETADRSYTYSDWGEMKQVDWTDSTFPSPVPMRLEQYFDAFGRISRTVELEDGESLPESEYSWFYDTDQGAPLSSSTFTTGRLTRTTSPIGDMYLSYDAFGRVDAREFVDTNSESYVENWGWHFDGTSSFLELRLSDTGYTPERYDYAYDTASRLRTVSTAGQQLFHADEIDPFGRLRSGIYGQSIGYTANHADVGRRLPVLEEVTLASGDQRSVVHGSYDAVGRELYRSEDRGDLGGWDPITYSYDVLGRVASSSEGGVPPTAASLDLEALTPSGHLHQVVAQARVAGSQGNGIRISMDDTIRSGVVQVVEQSTVDGYDLKIHFARNVATARDVVQAVNALSTTVQLASDPRYSYSPLQANVDEFPLTNMSGGSDGTPAFDSWFRYDPLGNVQSLIDSAGQTDLTFGTYDRDRVCRIEYEPGSGGTCNVVHDGSGNIVEQPTRDGNRHLTYFPSGAVRSIVQDKIDPVTGLSRTATASFHYDGSGEMSSLDVEGTSLEDPRHDRRYGLIERREVGGSSIIVRHIPGAGGMVASRRGADGPWIFPFGESRGMRFATDDRDAFVQEVSYSPFGKTASDGAGPGTLSYTPDQWNGGNSLVDFGLVHLGARLYDPVIGRFLSRDPLIVSRSANSTNPYAFAANDPINFSDPTGADFGICATSWGGPCGSSPPEDTSYAIPLAIATQAFALRMMFGEGSSGTSAPTLPPPHDFLIDGQRMLVFPEGTFRDDENDPEGFYYQLAHSPRGTAYPIDRYLGPPGSAQILSGLAWVYGDPSDDIGKLPPFRVVARMFLEVAMGGGFGSAGIGSRAVGAARGIEAAEQGGSFLFAHGTSPSSAASIAEGGLDSARASALTRGGSMSKPGSFFAFEIGPPHAPGPGFQLSYEFGMRMSPNPSIVIGRIPASLQRSLLERGLMQVRAIPGAPIPETIFSPAAFGEINAAATWTIITP